MADSESARWIRERGRRTVGRHYVDRREFTTAAGLPANRKIELDLPKPNSKFFRMATHAIGEWAVAKGVAVLTAVPNGANRYAAAAADEIDAPLVIYRKWGDGLDLVEQRRGGFGVLRDSPEPLIGIVEDARSTGHSMDRFAAIIGGGFISARGLAIVDRGQKVHGVTTVEEVRHYAREHPDEPPAHIELPFECDTLIEYPLPLKSWQ